MIPAMNFKNLPYLRPKKQKLLAAILVLIEEASNAGLKLSQGEIVKALFVADDSHFSKYGRPITFDNYVAMKNGPVGDLAVDMLKGNPNVNWGDFDLDQAPWSREDADGRSYYRAAAAAANRRKLSPSDVEELVAALDHVAFVGFGTISQETHRHPAWVSAWSAKNELDRAAAMDWRDFPAADPEVVSDLVMASWNAS